MLVLCLDDYYNLKPLALSSGTYFLPYKYTKFFDHLRAKPIPYDGFISMMRDIFQEWPAYEREAIIFQVSRFSPPSFLALASAHVN